MKPKFVIVRGIPGSGKTTLAKKLSKKYMYKLMDPDLINTESKQYQKFANKLRKEVPERRIKYRYLLKQTIWHLKKQRNVIWAQPWRLMERIDLTLRNIHFQFSNDTECWNIDLKKLLSATKFEPMVINLDLNSTKALKRIQERHNKGNHTWDGKSFKEHIKKYETFTLPIKNICIDAFENVDNVLINASRFINN